MAITKRIKVSFEAKVVIPTDDVVKITEGLVAKSKGLMAGEKLNGLELAGIEEDLTNGVESAIELALKGIISSNLKELLKDMDFSNFGNIRVVFKS